MCIALITTALSANSVNFSQSLKIGSQFFNGTNHYNGYIHEIILYGSDKSTDRTGIEKTPDGKAVTLVVSHVETTLDEMFFGHWRTENFKWERMANEVVGSLDLVVIHPITGYELRRTGAGSIVIMVDRAPQNLDNIERNRWALNADNKKPNALDLAFPKLKTECLKNAAVSFGKLLGRDLSRKNVDVYKPFKLKYWLNVERIGSKDTQLKQYLHQCLNLLMK